MKRSLTLGLALLLTACGNRGDLHPKTGETLPVKPMFATTTPTVKELIAPDSQAHPQRSSEEIDRSQDRRDDKFDLPPPG